MTAQLLRQMKIAEDFSSDGPVRYAHRTMAGMEIYFVSNRSGEKINTECRFRVEKGTPELWNPLSGETRLLKNFSRNKGITTIPIQFEPHQSFFVVFNQNKPAVTPTKASLKNFPGMRSLLTLDGSWKLSFDPIWGGPKEILFDHLVDWTKRPEEGIKYYSGTASYQKTFILNKAILASASPLFIELGEVNCMAQVTLNGIDLGTLWTTPWSLEITKAVKEGTNLLEIKVVNLWPNRLIGDEKFPSDGISDRKWPEWLLENKPRTSQRFTFVTHSFYKKDSPLLKSGLIGPVRIMAEEINK